jgi:Cft2 family RNA processing exonuclease
VKRVVFSGDIGPKGAPILRDPSPPSRADLVILESTYGDVDHPPQEQTVEQFAKVLKEAQAEGYRVLAPAFAVGLPHCPALLQRRAQGPAGVLRQPDGRGRDGALR